MLAPAEVTDRSALRRTLRAGSPLRELRDPHLVAIRDLVEERHRTAVVTDFTGPSSATDSTSFIRRSKMSKRCASRARI